MPSSRLSALAASLPAAHLDALALNMSPSLTYLTGLHFHVSERPVVLIVPTQGEPAIVLPELEQLKLADLPFAVRAFPYAEDPSTWDGVFGQALRALGLDGKHIGIEPLAMRLMEFRHLQAGAPGADFPDASDLVGRLRVCKDADEIAAMKKAVGVAQQALEAILPGIRVGQSEQEIANGLVVALLQAGSQPELPFSPIVSGGPNGANPHAVPSERPLKNGDLLVIDWGAAVDGYIADLTRTFAIGNVNDECRRIHKVVQDANAAGRAAGKPGAPCAAVDRAARQVIEQAGYGQYFTHRTGHGIGLEPHEDPYMRGDNQLLLASGMTYTVEPGIYLPGRNGVRIEDNLVITADGVECLSDMPRQMRTLG